VGTDQLQVVDASTEVRLCAAQVAASVVGSRWLIGSQKTEKPYDIPMHRWIASAAGGTNQRLNCGPAMVRSRDSRPEDIAVFVAIIISPNARLKRLRQLILPRSRDFSYWGMGAALPGSGCANT
jgi:hypothetical protein